MAIQINDWNKLDQDSQDRINAIIGQHFDGETVEAGTGAVAMTASSACETACNTIEAAATQACQALPFPASSLCVLAAQQAGNLCRSRC